MARVSLGGYQPLQLFEEVLHDADLSRRRLWLRLEDQEPLSVGVNLVGQAEGVDERTLEQDLG